MDDLLAGLHVARSRVRDTTCLHNAMCPNPGVGLILDSSNTIDLE